MIHSKHNLPSHLCRYSFLNKKIYEKEVKNVVENVHCGSKESTAQDTSPMEFEQVQK